ncbi:MAG: homoprotocatechuate degradation operon regulator HpaR [Burkholderiales bacterium]
MDSRARSQPAFTHRNLPLLLLQARERVIARFRPLLNACGITEQQWRVVRALFEIGPLEPRQIVTLCGISSPSLAGVLARMQEVGLVRRVRLDHDQRRVKVSLTPKGRTLAATMAPQVEAAYAELEVAVGPELVGQAYQLLDRLIVALEAEPDSGDKQE